MYPSSLHSYTGMAGFIYDLRLVLLPVNVDERRFFFCVSRLPKICIVICSFGVLHDTCDDAAFCWWAKSISGIVNKCKHIKPCMESGTSASNR